jgi:hypothetical protein
MVYTIAWAKDNGFDGVVILTGVTESLNMQTHKRMLKEIGQDAKSENLRFASVLEVPRPGEKSFIDNSKTAIMSRKTHIPVFVSLKNLPRLDTVAKLLAEFPENSRILIIDDEADQVSQDGNASYSKKDSTKVHKALAALYRNPSRKTLLLSYTATPQAILLTDRQSPIKPNFCSTIIPRDGYFGISDIVTSGIISENDSEEMDESPELENAIWDTVFAALTRRITPEKFYKNYSKEGDYNSSVQMLVHQSNKTQAHSDMERAVSEILLEIEEGLATENGYKTIEKQLSRYNSETENEIELDQEASHTIHELFRSIHLAIINSNYPSIERPVSDEDYEKHPIWIIIGGDIVGRGVTIPQLVTSFHTRNGVNFDTVLQQMRLCGYRGNYQHMLRMYTTPEISDFLAEMAYSETVMWSQVSDWDNKNMELSKLDDPVYFVSYSRQKMDPTRKGVQDRDTRDSSFSNSRQTVLSLKHIFDPNDFIDNLSLIQLISESHYGVPGLSKHQKPWMLFHEIDDILSSQWKASHPNDSGKLKLFNNLFYLPSDGDFFQHRHITNFPIQLLVDKRLIELAKELPGLDYSGLASRIAEYDASNATYNYKVLDANKSSSDIHFPEPEKQMEDWISSAISAMRADKKESSEFTSIRMSSPHIGDGQRALIRDTNVLPQVLSDGVTFIVEPVFGIDRSSRDYDATEVCFGIALSAVMNNDKRVNIRIVGHEGDD